MFHIEIFVIKNMSIFCGPKGHKTLQICPYVGFSRALGSSLPNPAGDFSASSVDMRISSASTLPCYILSVTELSGLTDLEDELIILILGIHWPPAFGPLLLEQVHGGD